MTTYSDNKPEVFEPIGNGGFRYNYHIEEIEVDNFINIDNEEDNTITKRTQWRYDNVLIYPPITKDKITRAVITNTWNSDYENKLINDYNEISLGNLTEEEIDKRTNKYIAFLQERKRLKEIIDNDWETIKDIIKS